MTIELLSYADYEHRRSGSLDWQPVSVRLPRPPRDPFATGTLHTALLARLPDALGLAAGDLERVMVFASPNPAALRVIAYAKGRRFAALDLPLSGPPAKWHALLLKQPAWGSETRTQLFTPNQCCNWPFDGDLETNPVRALRQLAPNSFNLARIRREKERFLTQRQGLGNPSNANPAHVTARFQQLLDQRGVSPSPPDPAGLAERWARMEVSVGAAPPPAFRALYALLDGSPGLFFGHDFLSLDASAHTWLEWRQIFDEWTLADLTGNTLPQRGVTQGIYCCPRWIPFVDLVAGNALAIDLLPAKRGHVGQVIAFGADHDQILCVAPDLEAFLDLCLSYQPGRGPLADVFG